jgi:hypothetical protein
MQVANTVWLLMTVVTIVLSAMTLRFATEAGDLSTINLNTVE